MIVLTAFACCLALCIFAAWLDITKRANRPVLFFQLGFFAGFLPLFVLILSR